MSKPFARARKRVDLDGVRFHDLRHWYATQLISQRAHPRMVELLLGHSNVGITLSVYAHVLPGADAAVVSALDTLRVASTPIEED